MQIPLQISFRNMDASDAVEADIRDKVGKLDRFYERITGCRVIVEAPHRHRHKICQCSGRPLRIWRRAGRGQGGRDHREKDKRHVPAADSSLLAGDVLVLRSDPHALRRVIEDAQLDLGGSSVETQSGQAAGRIGVVEAVVMTGSALVGCSSAKVDLRVHYGLSLIAISRHGEEIATHLRHVRFQAGDVLVLQGGVDGMLETLKTLGCLPLVDRATGLGRHRQEYLPLILLGLAARSS